MGARRKGRRFVVDATVRVAMELEIEVEALASGAVDRALSAAEHQAYLAAEAAGLTPIEGSARASIDHDGQDVGTGRPVLRADAVFEAHRARKARLAQAAKEAQAQDAAFRKARWDAMQASLREAQEA